MIVVQLSKCEKQGYDFLPRKEYNRQAFRLKHLSAEILVCDSQ